MGTCGTSIGTFGTCGTSFGTCGTFIGTFGTWGTLGTSFWEQGEHSVLLAFQLALSVLWAFWQHFKMTLFIDFF
jgi:hypothetical protein